MVELSQFQFLAMSLCLFLMAWVVGWIQGTEPWKRKVKELQSLLESDSAQKMERVLAMEERLRWAQAKVKALESDLERMNQKLSGSGMDLPQHRGTYWKMEWEKANLKVSELEMELERVRSKAMGTESGWA